MACLLETLRDSATIGVEQNRPILTPGVAKRALSAAMMAGADGFIIDEERLLKAYVILSEESHLGHVIDPTGGAYVFEKLTVDLIVDAWKHFQDIEDAGGNEVLFVGHLNRVRQVTSVEVFCRGNEFEVPALLQVARQGNVVIHNHPRGV